MRVNRIRDEPPSYTGIHRLRPAVAPGIHRLPPPGKPPPARRIVLFVWGSTATAACLALLVVGLHRDPSSSFQHLQPQETTYAPFAACTDCTPPPGFTEPARGQTDRADRSRTEPTPTAPAPAAVPADSPRPPPSPEPAAAAAANPAPTMATPTVCPPPLPAPPPVQPTRKPRPTHLPKGPKVGDLIPSVPTFP